MTKFSLKGFKYNMKSPPGDHSPKTISEINIRNEKISFFKSKLSEDQKDLASIISSDINAHLIVLRTEITQLESQLIQNNVL